MGAEGAELRKTRAERQGVEEWREERRGCSSGFVSPGLCSMPERTDTLTSTRSGSADGILQQTAAPLAPAHFAQTTPNPETLNWKRCE